MRAAKKDGADAARLQINHASQSAAVSYLENQSCQSASCSQLSSQLQAPVARFLVRTATGPPAAGALERDGADP